MNRIGITGHRSIPDGAQAHVLAGLRAALCGLDGATQALSSLAVGADQLFADLALTCGAELTVVIPSGDYEACFENAADLARYRLLKPRGGRRARRPLRRLLAVWDGRPARGLGGTGDIVTYARTLGRPVTVIWRDGVERG
ncbi:DNA recombination-mediator protein A OS=Streptomyces microflavus OX=1919 GN=Smic_14170 PE=4 SV=1 [Streptomyces microflavus]